MQELFSVIARAVLTISGPTAKHLLRRSAARPLSELVSELASDPSTTKVYSRIVATELTEAGVSQTHRIELGRFCASPEGALVFRLIAINAVAGEPLDDSVREALGIQVAAAIRLFTQDRAFPAADEAGQILARTGSAVAVDLFGRLHGRDDKLANRLRLVASAQAKLPELFHEREIEGRSEALTQLIGTLPTRLDEEIRLYGSTVLDASATLTVSAVGPPIVVPLIENLTQPAIAHRGGSDALRDLPGMSAGSVLSRALAVHGHLVLLGDPGGGKSTAVKASMFELARAVVDGDISAVPFSVTLRHYARSMEREPELGFVQFLARTYAAEHDAPLSLATIRYLLHTGRAVVFFDGLDEVLDIDTRVRVADRIGNFSRRFAASSVVVTSRAVGYDQAPVPGAVATLTLLPLTTVEVSEFSARLFEILGARNHESDESLPERFMLDSRPISDLRSNPLLLSVLCCLFAGGGRLPTDRYQLYQRCADVLFSSWDEDRGLVVQLRDADAAEAAVREIALRVFEGGQEEISAGELRGLLENSYTQERTGAIAYSGRAFAKEVMRAWTGRKWVLAFAGESHGEDYYRFAHRTFLEYFAADQISFESASSEDAWRRVSTYARQGSATTVCELVLQMMSSKTKGAADRFVAAALAEEATFEGDVRGSYNVLNFLLSTLPGLRSSSETRDAVMRRGLDLYAQLIPAAPLSAVRRHGRRPLIGSHAVLPDGEGTLHDVITGVDDPNRDARAQRRPPVHDGDGGQVARGASHLDQSLEGQDPLTGSEIGTTDSHLDAVSSIFKTVARYDVIERRRLLDQAAKHIEASLATTSGAVDDWWRMALSFRLFGDLSSWAHLPEGVRRDWTSAGETLWQRLVASGARPRLGDAESTDYWLQVIFLREQNVSSRAVVAALEPRGLLLGGWPYVSDRPSSMAGHSLLLAILGLATGSGSRWSRADVSEMSSQVVAHMCSSPVLHTFAPEAAALWPGGGFEVLEPVAALTEDEWIVTHWLVKSLAQRGDENFLTGVLKLLEPTMKSTLQSFLEDEDRTEPRDEHWRRTRIDPLPKR